MGRRLASWAALAGSSLVLCAFALVSSCHSPPARDQLIDDGGARPHAANAACATPLDAQLRRAAPSEDQLAFACRMHQLETAFTRRPLVPGNHVTLLVDGPVTHAAQLEAIAQARHHVHLNAYILADDAVGQKYREALSERARAGVAVRMMFDSIGALDAGSEYRQALEDAGVELHEYASINPLEEPELWRIAQRNHRKLLVVDGRVAFTGGIGISDVYSQSPVPGSGSGSPEHGWRDTHIEITGPAVAEFQRLFVQNWEAEVGPIPPDPAYWPKLDPTGDDLVRAVATEGQDFSALLTWPLEMLPESESEQHDSRSQDARDHAIYASYLAAITESRSRVWITQAYFAPNPEFLDALKEAAHRGEDVRLLVPANSDVGLVLHASRSYYADLLDAGVRIFEYEGPVLHAKTAVVDGVWSTVGSSNLDYRSFLYNEEANAIIVGQSFGREMEAMFRADLENAREVTREAWSDRPLTDRLLQSLAHALKYWI